MRILVLITLTISLTSSVIGQSRSDLEKQVAMLKQQVGAKEASVDTLSKPWQTQRMIDISLSSAPLIRLIQQFNSLPPAQRAIEASVTDSYGQLWGWDADCKVGGVKYGEEGAYVEFNDPNYRVQARVELSNFSAAWVAGQGLDLSVDGSAHVEVGMLHWHRKPCVGGGVGGHAGPLTCDASARLNASTSLSYAAVNNTLNYAASLNLSAIPYNCSVNLGSAGTLQLSSLVPAPAPVGTGGSLPVPLVTAGKLESPDSRFDLHKEYEITLTNPGFQVTSGGLDLGTDVSITWK